MNRYRAILLERYAGPTQGEFNWDEAEHPREVAKHDGKLPGQFAPKESATARTATEAARQGASRRKSNIGVFVKPIVGPSGASLIAYDWKWTWEPSEDGEDERKVSDWQRSERNELTGRDIVHHFHVRTPDGLQIVSVDSAIKLLGLAGEAGNRIRNLGTALMKLAQAKQKLDAMKKEGASEFQQKWQQGEIDRLEKHAKLLESEAAKKSKGENPVDEYRDLLRRVHATVEAMRTDADGTKRSDSWGAVSQMVKVLRKERSDLSDSQIEAIKRDGIRVFNRLNMAAGLNVLGERTPKSPYADDHTFRNFAKAKNETIKASSDMQMRNWFKKSGEAAQQAIKDAEEWLEAYGTKTERYAAMREFYAGKRQMERYDAFFDLYLAPDSVFDAITAIERYEWRAEEHPRWERGSAGSVGGRFRGQGTSRLREIAALPDTVQPGHQLHLSSLGNRDRMALQDWTKRLHEAMAHVKGDDEENQWQSTNKGYIRALLQEMNERDRDARARGVRLSDYVNANGLIPEALASRLHGGRRFFDPELIRDKLKTEPGVAKKAAKEAADKTAVREFQQGSRDQRKAMLAPESSFREAIMRAMGLNPDLKGPEDPGGHWQTLGNKNRTEAGDSVETLPSTKPKPINPSAPEAAPASFSEPQQPEQGSGAVASTKTEFDALPKRSQKKIDEAIRSIDPEMTSDEVADVRSEVMDTWKQLSEQANEHNHAVRQIMGGFTKHWGLVSARLKQGADLDKIKGFDEMVDFARSHHPGVLSQNRGESDTGSDEESLAKVLKEGLKPVPKPWDDQVIQAASERIGAAMAAASRFQPDPELDSVPFSVARWAEIIRYAMNEKLPIPFFGTIAL